ncbi:hypothetical protein L9F63_023643, partial [Diploptera punctata]
STTQQYKQTAYLNISNKIGYKERLPIANNRKENERSINKQPEFKKRSYLTRRKIRKPSCQSAERKQKKIDYSQVFAEAN